MTECASPIIDEIRRLVMQYAADKTGPQIESPIDGLFFSVRYGSTGTCTCSVYEPSVALMLQGRKMTTAGTRVYTYGRGDLLITSMDVPTTYQVLEASPDKPFVGIGIRIDAVVMTDLIRQLPLEDDAADDASVRAITLCRAEAALEEDFLRLVQILDSPRECKFRAPLIIRDIYSLLLLGEHGESIRRIFTNNSRSSRISQAVGWLRDNYREPLSVEALADRVHMSVSSFHRHFKSVTSVSPLQFQKRLRLSEAQRLMLTEGKDVATAAYEVGYASPTQFSREYKHAFGEAPGRDIEARRRLVECPVCCQAPQGGLSLRFFADALCDIGNDKEHSVAGHGRKSETDCDKHHVAGVRGGFRLVGVTEGHREHKNHGKDGDRERSAEGERQIILGSSVMLPLRSPLTAASTGTARISSFSERKTPAARILSCTSRYFPSKRSAPLGVKKAQTLKQQVKKRQRKAEGVDERVGLIGHGKWKMRCRDCPLLCHRRQRAPKKDGRTYAKPAGSPLK